MCQTGEDYNGDRENGGENWRELHFIYKNMYTILWTKEKEIRTSR